MPVDHFVEELAEFRTAMLELRRVDAERASIYLRGAALSVRGYARSLEKAKQLPSFERPKRKVEEE